MGKRWLYFKATKKQVLLGKRGFMFQSNQKAIRFTPLTLYDNQQYSYTHNVQSTCNSNLFQLNLFYIIPWGGSGV